MDVRRMTTGVYAVFRGGFFFIIETESFVLLSELDALLPFKNKQA